MTFESLFYKKYEELCGDIEFCIEHGPDIDEAAAEIAYKYAVEHVTR